MGWKLVIGMTLASPRNFSQDTFGFLSTSRGQLVLVVGSVFFLLMVKNMTRPSDEHAFRRDDLAVGLDLLVLSLVTLIGYADSQFVAEKTAKASNHPTIASNASTNQVNSGFLALAITILMVAVIWMIQRVGRYSPAEREKREHDDRFKPFFGLIVPGSIGALMLFVAIKSAVQ